MAALSAAAEAALSAARAEFTAAFNKNRTTLAGFARCESLAELHAVRDAFHLGMASALCPAQHAQVLNSTVKAQIVQDLRAAAPGGGLAQTIAAARKDAAAWDGMVAGVMAKARFVGSDLGAIWGRLETGRLEWIAAYRATRAIKTNLRAAMEAINPHRSTKADLKYSLMMWMYAMASVIPGDCRDSAVAWAAAVAMQDPRAPLKGFNPEKWNIQAAEWEPLDLALQAAADRGGTDLQAAWEAHPPAAAVRRDADKAATAVIAKPTATDGSLR
jgi:hypothetical protein